MVTITNLTIDWQGFVPQISQIYVYVDRTIDSDHVFYVGKGTRHRVELKRARNKKHGRVALKHGIIRSVVNCISAKDELLALERERSLIVEHNTYMTEHGCNFTRGGDGVSGYRFSDDARAKMSEMRRGRKLADDVKKRISDAHKGKTLSAEHRQNLSESRRTKATSEKQLQVLKRARAARKPVTVSNRFLAQVNNGRNRSIEQLNNEILVSTFISIAAAARATGINPGSIGSCCRGTTMTAGGFVWRYAVA